MHFDTEVEAYPNYPVKYLSRSNKLLIQRDGNIYAEATNLIANR